MGKTRKPKIPSLAGIGGLDSKKRQELFGRAADLARRLRTKKPARPRLGQRGISGPRGKWFGEKMASDLARIAGNKKSPNWELAEKVNRVLLASRKGLLNIDASPHEHQLLVNIMNGILLKEQGKVSRKFNSGTEQARLLEKLDTIAKELQR